MNGGLYYYKQEHDFYFYFCQSYVQVNLFSNTCWMYLSMRSVFQMEGIIPPFPSSLYFSFFSHSWEQDKGICPCSPDTTMRSLGFAATVLRNRLSALPCLPQLPVPQPSFRWRWSTEQSTVWHAEREREGLIGQHKLWLYRNFDVLWNGSWVRTAGKEEVQKITVFCALSCNITDLTWAKNNCDECLSSHMLNAWWAMLHIPPPVYFQVMSLCLPTSREFFFSVDKVGTFWISTRTVLVRTLYDAFTVKITPSALHVRPTSFSSRALSRAFTHTKARYGVLALSLYRPKWSEKGKHLRVFLLVLWVPKNPKQTQKQRIVMEVPAGHH